jgi:hypothetical protein
MQQSTQRKYLFFVSQNYSFPVLRPLQIEILSQGHQVKWFLFGENIDLSLCASDEERLLSVDEIIEYNPDAVFVPGNVAPSFIPGLKVEVFHGLPGNKSTRKGEIYHYIIRGMFDLYCTQGPESTQKFQLLSQKYEYFNVRETGWCKLDPLFPITNKKNDTRKSILFASTFSPRFSKARELYPFLYKMMQEHTIDWYITLHPIMPKDIVARYKSINLPNVKFIEPTQLIEHFRLSDMMLCDTSSIVYEFLSQIKPVVTYQTEKKESSIIDVEKLEDLEAKILYVLDNLELNRENITQSVKKFHPYNDGKSSQRVLKEVEKMLLGIDLPKKRKPMNFIRNLKLRKELNYWKIRI